MAIAQIPRMDNLIKKIPGLQTRLQEIEEANKGQSFEEFIQKKIFSEEASALGEKLLKNPVLDILAETIQSQVNSVLITDGILWACKKELQHAKKNKDLVESKYGKKHKERNWLARNLVSNWVRLVMESNSTFFDIKEIPYDDVHTKEIYKFSNTEKPSSLCTKLTESEEIRGKKILTLGPGAGEDERHFLEKDAIITTIEGSENKRNQLKKKFKKFLNKVEIKESPSEITAALKEMAKNSEKSDYIYAHSVFHFFDKEEIRNILKNSKEILNDGGKIIFNIKTKGALMDGIGICLKKENEYNAFLNPDGQTRYFYTFEYIKRALESNGFQESSTIKNPEVTISDYGIEGTDQKFYNFIYEKI